MTSAEHPPGPPGGEQGVRGAPDVIEPSRLQRTWARRMAESKATAPDFSIEAEIDMTACVELRERRAAAGAGPAPTYTDLVVRACARALRERPEVNAAYRDGALERYPHVNVGIAVATEDGLAAPVIRDADTLGLPELAARTAAAAERVRSGAATSPELAGATFTVANLGMHGVDRVTPILVPPQAAVLGVGAIARRAAVDDASGDVVARPTARLVLVCDHRILLGVEAARFLARVRELLESEQAEA